MPRKDVTASARKSSRFGYAYELAKKLQSKIPQF
jgi:hypothetical protein